MSQNAFEEIKISPACNIVTRILMLWLYLKMSQEEKVKHFKTTRHDTRGGRVKHLSLSDIKSSPRHKTFICFKVH